MSINYRSQNDGLAEKVSLETAIAFNPDDDFTRQEFTDDADVNTIIRKFGSNLPLRPVQYSEMDTDVGLLDAYTAVEQARAAYADLPATLHKAYPTWQRFVEAINNGEIKLEPASGSEGVPPERKEAEPPVGDAK